MLYHYLTPQITAEANISLGTFIHGVGLDQSGPQVNLMIDCYGDKIAMFQNQILRVYKIGADATLTIIYDSVVAGQPMGATYQFGLQFSPDGTKLFAVTSAAVGSNIFRYRRAYTISGDTVTLTNTFSTAAGTATSLPVNIFYVLDDEIFYGWRSSAGVSNQFSITSETYALSITNTSLSPLGGIFQCKSVMLGNKLIDVISSGAGPTYYLRAVNRDPATYALTDAAGAPGTTTSQLSFPGRGMCKVDESHFLLMTDNTLIYYKFDDATNTFTELSSGAAFLNPTTAGGGTWDMSLIEIDGIKRIIYKSGSGATATINYVIVNGDSCSSPATIGMPFANGTGPFIYFYYCEQYDWLIYISTDHGTGARARFYKGSSVFN